MFIHKISLKHNRATKHPIYFKRHFWVALSVDSPLFFRKIIEIERFLLRAANLHECQNYLGGGGRMGGSEKNIFLAPPPPPTPQSYNPRRPPPRYIWKLRYPWR